MDALGHLYLSIGETGKETERRHGGTEPPTSAPQPSVRAHHVSRPSTPRPLGFSHLSSPFRRTHSSQQIHSPLPAPLLFFAVPYPSDSESSKAMASPDAEQPAPTEPARWRDLDMLLSRPGNLVEASFDPSPTVSGPDPPPPPIHPLFSRVLLLGTWFHRLIRARSCGTCWGASWRCWWWARAGSAASSSRTSPSPASRSCTSSTWTP